MDIIDDQTVDDVWLEQVNRHGSNEWLTFESATGRKTTYSYSEFEKKIELAARVLHTQGVEKEDNIVVHLPNQPEFLQIWLAIMRVGGVAVVSNTNHTPREINYTVADSEAELVITTSEYAEIVAESVDGTSVQDIIIIGSEDQSQQRDDKVKMFSEVAQRANESSPDRSISAEDPAQILYTSGTTGDPKGVIHTHANLLYTGELASKHYAIRDTDRLCAVLPLFHANAQANQALPAIVTGAHLILLEEFKTDEFISQLRNHSATLTSIVGTQARALLSKPEKPSDSDHDLREIIYAINISDEQKEQFVQRFDVSLVNVYGLTESGIPLVSASPLYGERLWPSIGKPLINRDVYIVDREGNPIETSEVGEIAVDGIPGRTLFKEYYNMPEKTEEAFTDDGLLLTGDYGRFDEDGYLYFEDRKKNIIETRGENVSENEVEKVLERHPDIDEVAAVGIPHDYYGEAVKVYIKTFNEMEEENVLAYARKNLAEYKIPEAVEFIDEFPRTSIGKIEKSSLRD